MLLCLTCIADFRVFAPTLYFLASHIRRLPEPRPDRVPDRAADRHEPDRARQPEQQQQWQQWKQRR